MSGTPEPRPPLWHEEFPVREDDERYVTRRQFSRFLVLTSLGMFVGNLWILAKTWLRKETASVAARIARIADLPVGESRVFEYPAPGDPCLLIRTGDDRFVAYSQKCTHLSCAVVWSKERGRIECPCHLGYFSPEDGRVLQGPPPRPLPRVLLERRGDDLYAVGIAPGSETGA